MTTPELARREAGAPSGPDDLLEPPPPTFGDALRFLWDRRVQLAKYFAVCLILGVGAVTVRSLLAPRSAEATLSLGFKGIEKHEYPNGKKFTVSDLRSPKVLRSALAELGRAERDEDLARVAADVELLPVIPAEVLARWRKADRDGQRREVYLPSDFRMTARPAGFSDEESAQLLYAMVKAYQEEIKFEQLGALRFMSEIARYRADQLIELYDYWDVPRILSENTEVLTQHLTELTHEAQSFQDPNFNTTFRDLEQDLRVWSSTRLESLRGLVDSDRLVKNSGVMTKRLRARQEVLDIRLRGLAQEEAEARALLESLERPRAALATALSSQDGLPLVDTSTLERLVASDYVGELVRRISKLQSEKAALQETRWATDRDLLLLERAQDVPLTRLPPGFQSLVGAVTEELKRIVDSYNHLLDSYLEATVTSQVVLRDGPRIVRSGPSTIKLLAVVVFAAAGLALLLVVFSHSVSKAIASKG